MLVQLAVSALAVLSSAVEMKGSISSAVEAQATGCPADKLWNCAHLCVDSNGGLTLDSDVTVVGIEGTPAAHSARRDSFAHCECG